MQLEGLHIGRYHLMHKLGSGGMGEVFLAEDARIGQQVAIKVMQSDGSPYPDTHATPPATRLFQREAMAIVRLDHPHILPLFDYGETSVNGETLSYLVMPFRHEGSLVDWLRRRGASEPLSLQDVAHIVSQSADALQHSHDQQIIHQDVKPSNLLIREKREDPNRPDVLLADFGIARFISGAATTSQVIRGTPAYMAPEQWAHHPVPATDQYALAIMTYELLTGRLPFQGGSMQMMYQHLNVQPSRPSALNADLPADVDAVLLHALAKEPSDRFASIAAFAQTFRQSLQHAGAARSLQAQNETREGDIYVVLAISEDEARQGTTRVLTLLGGQRINVAVPAGIQDGHVVRLVCQGEPADAGGAPSTLKLIIEVQPTAAASLSSNAAGAEPTLPLLHATNPTIFSETGPTALATGRQDLGDRERRPPVAPAATTPTTRGDSQRGIRQRWLAFATALLILLLLFGGAAFAAHGAFTSTTKGVQSVPVPVHLTPGSIHSMPGTLPSTPTKVIPATPTPLPPTPTLSTSSPAPSPTRAPAPSPTPPPAPSPTPPPAPSPTPPPAPSPTPPPAPSPTPPPTPASSSSFSAIP